MNPIKEIRNNYLATQMKIRELKTQKMKKEERKAIIQSKIDLLDEKITSIAKPLYLQTEIFSRAVDLSLK